MQFFKKILVLTIWLFAVGCGIYQSEGRKQFEAQVQPTRFGIGFDLSEENCKSTPSLGAWLQVEELPAFSELEYSKGKLEVWKFDSENDSTVNIKTILPYRGMTYTCQHQFENLMSWSQNKEQFIQEALHAEDENQSL